VKVTGTAGQDHDRTGRVGLQRLTLSLTPALKDRACSRGAEENDEMPASWNEMIDAVAARSGMWVGRARYSLVRCFVQGYGAGRGDDVLDRFQRWLSEQPQHASVRNYAWWYLVLREVFDHGKEDELAYPGDDALAIDHLFTRLREFLMLSAIEDG
jgi:hypothetical protein